MNSPQLKRGLEFVKIVKLSALNYIFLESLFFFYVLISYWMETGHNFLFICFMSVSVYVI